MKNGYPIKATVEGPQMDPRGAASLEHDWRKLRRRVQHERRQARATDGLSKDGKTIAAAQESAFTTVLWLMDKIEKARA